MDRVAARRATLVSVVVVVLLLVGQSAVSAALTAGHQPMPVRERVADSPTADAWGDVPARTVELSAQRMALPYGGGSVDTMRVQAMTNKTHVAFRLSWPDATRDTNISRPEAYSDAVAVMVHGGSQPPITMGATGTPVNIWYWRGSWQYGDHTGTGSWTGSMYAYPHPEETTKPGLAAGNPLSKDEYKRYGQNYYAKGYGSLSYAPAQNVRASGAWSDGRWRVVFVRERTTNGTYDAAFDESSSMYVTVAVWNGSADEVNGQKSLSYQFLRLDTQSGELAAVEQGGSGGSGGDSGDAATADGGAGDGEGLPDRFWNSLGTLLAVVLVTWLVAYRGTRGDDK